MEQVDGILRTYGHRVHGVFFSFSLFRFSFLFFLFFLPFFLCLFSFRGILSDGGRRRISAAQDPGRQTCHHANVLVGFTAESSMGRLLEESTCRSAKPVSSTVVSRDADAVGDLRVAQCLVPGRLRVEYRRRSVPRLRPPHQSIRASDGIQRDKRNRASAPALFSGP